VALAAALAVAAKAGGDAPPVRASLRVAVAAFTPGEPFDAAVELVMPPGWHTYWIRPGDAGLPTEVDWRLPPGFEAGAIEWPAPERFAQGGLASYGYAGQVLLPVRICPPREWPAGEPVELVARVRWLQCREACVPGEAMVTARVVSASAAVSSADAEAVAAARRALPERDPSVRAKARWDGATLIVQVDGLRERRPRLFAPLEGDAIPPAAAQVWSRGGEGAWTVRIPLARGASFPSTLPGVLLLDEGRPLTLEIVADRRRVNAEEQKENRR